MKDKNMDEVYLELFKGYKDIVEIPQLLKMLNISRPTAYDLIQSGRIPAFKIGGKYKIPKKCVIDFLFESMDDYAKKHK